MTHASYPLFVKRDLDGFFGLLIDNLVQLLLMPALCGGLAGMTGADSRFVTQHILPGAALSILVGNVFYAWQAHRLAKRTGRSDITALPYGINTPSLLVFIFFVMAPVYQETKSAEAAWQMGLLACWGSGLIEFSGAFLAEWVRRRTPRAALLSTLAGIAIGFISMSFALQIFQKPLVAMLPLAIVLLALFARVSFPLGLPGGLIAVILGTCCAWLLPSGWTGVQVSTAAVGEAWSQRGLQWPHFAGGAVIDLLRTQPVEKWIGYLSVIIPMGLFNLIGSLQNIESAEAAGDPFATRSSLAANGLGTMVAALFGSCFPTTIYIGHAGWKGLGARAGYSTLNGVVIMAICLTGTVPLISSVVPIEAGMGIVLWVGIIITAQAFQTTPLAHAPAVAVGLFPAIAAWGLTVVQGAFLTAEFMSYQPQTVSLVAPREISSHEMNSREVNSREVSSTDNAVRLTALHEETPEPAAVPPPAVIHLPITMQQALTTERPPLLRGLATEMNGYLLHGLIIMERGYIFTCMMLAAICAFLIDRKFYSAGMWSLVAALFAALGLTHAYQLQGNSLNYFFNEDLFFGQAAPAANILIYRAFPIAVGYLLFAGLFLSFGWYQSRYPLAETDGHV